MSAKQHWSASRDGFTVSTDPALIDLDMVHGYLTTSYWAEGVTKDLMHNAIEHSLNFGLYEGKRQIGFARVITDRATYAYLADVFILEPYRGRGFSKWIMQCVISHPELQGLRRWGLVTRDAHGLYKQFGFTPLKNPERFMELHRPDIYKVAGGSEQVAGKP